MQIRWEKSRTMIEGRERRKQKNVRATEKEKKIEGGRQIEIHVKMLISEKLYINTKAATAKYIRV